MQVQKSFTQTEQYTLGTLYLIGTPIGNLDDITYRAVHMLQEVDWIAAEDTRQTRKLLAHYDIRARMLSYHEHNKETSGVDIIDKLMQGDSVALVSDAGMPAISDPGYELVKQAVAKHIRVVPIPGPNAALSALIVSGLATRHFLFIGFLPKDAKKRRALIEKTGSIQATLIIYESPHRIARTLQQLLEAWGDRRIVIARELTKKYEEVARGTISKGLELLNKQTAKGEYCIIIEGNKEPTEAKKKEMLWWSLYSLEEHVAYYEQEGLTHKEAMKKVADDRKVTRRDVYNKLLANKKKSAP